MDIGKYAHKEVWTRRSDKFVIEVVRWQYENPFEGGMNYVWNVYCYIYPSHPLFNKLEKDIDGGRIIENFHGGCTYCQWYRDENNNVTCKQYGSDYNHFGDDNIIHVKDPNRAYEVFNDVDALFEELEGAK